MKEKVELGGGYVLLQPKGVYPCGTDSVLLSAFAAENGKGNRFADLCTGGGVIPLLLCKRRSDITVFGIELSEYAASIAAQNVEVNQLSQRVQIICDDVRNISAIADEGVYDCVTVNPPYMKAGSGIPPKDERMLLATQEIRCTADDIIKAAAYLLKDGGSLFMIHLSDRKAEILKTVSENALSTVMLREIFPRRDAKSKVFLLHAKKGKYDAFEEKPLVMYENGAYTEEVARIYGE